MGFEIYRQLAEEPGVHASKKNDMDVDMGAEATDLASDHWQVEDMDTNDTKQYHQAEQISGHDVDDWFSLPELPPRRLGEVQSVANIYRSSFTILLQAWKCSSPAECIPEELRLLTPYSLGLVVRLAELALLTPSGKEEAHTMLLTLTHERAAGTQLPPGEIVFTGMARGMQHKRYVEHRVQEYVHGLIIDDVEMANMLCITSGDQQIAAPVESRADRAIKRLNKSHSWPLDSEGGLHPEAHVGGGARDHEWLKSQQKQHKQRRQHRGPYKPMKLHRIRKSREDLNARKHGDGQPTNDVSANNGDQMDGVLAEDQKPDSMSALPSGQPQGLSGRQKRSRASRAARNALNSNRRLDGHLANIFKGIDLDKKEAPDDSLNYDEEL